MVVFTEPKNGLLRIRRLLEMHPLQPHAVCLALRALGCRDGLVGESHSDPPTAFRGRELAGILLAMVFARSAAMAFNRLADRHLDALNPRTRRCHLSTGTLSVPGVAAFTVLCGLGFVASTLLFLPDNPLPLVASLPVLLFLFAYSFTKRFTVLAHFWLGTRWPCALGRLGGHSPRLPWRPWCWRRGRFLGGWFRHDLCLPRRRVRCQEQLHSIPARFGVPAALRLAALCHAGMVLLLRCSPWSSRASAGSI